MADSPYFKEQKNIEKPKMIFFFFEKIWGI